MTIQSFAFCYLAKVVVYSYFHRLGKAQRYQASFAPFMVVPADNVQNLVGIGPTFSTSHELCCNLPPRTQQHGSLQLRGADFRWADFSFSIHEKRGELGYVLVLCSLRLCLKARRLGLNASVVRKGWALSFVTVTFPSVSRVISCQQRRAPYQSAFRDLAVNVQGHF